MAKKITNLLILLPLGIILIIFCVANRKIVTLAFNPFRPEDQVLSLSAPFFVFIFIALIIAMEAGLRPLQPAPCGDLPHSASAPPPWLRCVPACGACPG